VKHLPSLGYYASTSGDVIEQHLRMAEHMDLDFLACNLHVGSTGLSQEEFEGFSLLLERAEYLRSPVKICAQLCLYGCSESDLVKTCSILRSTAYRHLNYLSYHGKPFLSVFWTGQYDGDAVFLRLLRKHTEPAILLASSLRMYAPHEEQALTFGVFDGWSLFSPLELSSPARWETLWREAYDNAVAGRRNIRCVTVSPGYDDTALTSFSRQGNPYRLVPREDGAVYRRMWNFALGLSDPPDFVLVSTFNEFHENTHVEPTVAEGTQYLELTVEYIREGRKAWNR
jgi:hypothetical protein